MSDSTWALIGVGWFVISLTILIFHDPGSWWFFLHWYISTSIPSALLVIFGLTEWID